ncbi:hypothetical protein ACFYKX_11155 [Cytobacillus sp. FJAT-54145]|uniref:Winged helix-turn helix domain-containing protein n=1 Tax=Cytobacillus spartinae TaxID=3299023 RepID=A0ABW6KC43_9BACI
MPTKSPNLKDVAAWLLFRKITEFSILQHYDYRNGKSWADVHQAIRRTFREGHGRVECEVQSLGLRLPTIFKPKRRNIV